jgi:hypothetical protein
MFSGQLFLSVILLFSTLQNELDGRYKVVEDLLSQVESSNENLLIGKCSKGSKVVNLRLDLSQKRGNYLLIESKNPFYVFINSVYAIKGTGERKLSADSLRTKYSNTILISLYQKEGVKNLSAKWVMANKVDEFYNPKRPAQTFSNFILVASIVLILFFTALYQTNPQLTLDYLNVIKLFYLRDREETQITLRITSSVNLLFYLFCSLLASLALMTVANFSNEGLSVLDHLASSNTSYYLTQWTLLALVILATLVIKLAFASLFGSIYGWTDIAGFQFFNFVRVLILSLGFIAVVSVFCFSFKIDVNYFSLLKAGCILLIVGVGLLYFKLLTRTSFRSFHLFSYLCATEIFPLVILVKVLLF